MGRRKQTKHGEEEANKAWGGGSKQSMGGGSKKSMGRRKQTKHGEEDMTQSAYPNIDQRGRDEADLQMYNSKRL